MQEPIKQPTRTLKQDLENTKKSILKTIQRLQGCNDTVSTNAMVRAFLLLLSRIDRIEKHHVSVSLKQSDS